MPEIKSNNNLQNVSSTPSTVPVTADVSRFRGFLVFAALVLLAYSAPLLDLAGFVWGNRSYQFVLLIPFVSVYLIFENRSKLTGPWKPSPLPAVLFGVIGVGAIAFLYSGTRPMHLSDHFALVAVSFWSLIVGGGFYFFGTETLRKVTFPVAFLIFAIPIPSSLMHWTQVQLQYASAEAAAWMMSAINVPYLRAENGLDFKLSTLPIRVAEECSGFNSSVVLFILSLLAGYLFLTAPWKRALLAFIVIPLAILRNGFRITTLAWLCTNKGPHWIDSPIHHQGGPLFFALSLIPFLAVVLLLRRSERKKDSLI
jgi:exosortase C (VPDSG-CTERM-specific)